MDCDGFGKVRRPRSVEWSGFWRIWNECRRTTRDGSGSMRVDDRAGDDWRNRIRRRRTGEDGDVSRWIHQK